MGASLSCGLLQQFLQSPSNLPNARFLDLPQGPWRRAYRRGVSPLRRQRRRQGCPQVLPRIGNIQAKQQFDTAKIVRVAEDAAAPVLPATNVEETQKAYGMPPTFEAGVRAYPAWARAVQVVAEFYEVEINAGLCEEAVQTRRAISGWNELKKPAKNPIWKLVLQQFEDTLVQILLAAAGVSILLALSDNHGSAEAGVGAFTEPIIILSIITLNAVIGVWQGTRAEKTLEALKSMQSERSRVIRQGKEIPDLPSKDLVPGDVVELRAGDKVPADMRIVRLKSATVRLQQASLTGESQPVLKQTEESSAEDVELQGKECMVFAGTTVTNGTCVCIVTATGMETEMGKIQTQIEEASLEDYDTPLSRNLDEFAELLTKVVGAVCVTVWLVNYKYFVTWDPAHGITLNLEQATYYFKVAVALAVAAIPEGLPAVITTCLALGTRRMAEENAIVRKLPSVETLGCTTVICSDKTGTLTTNQMSVKEITAVGEAGELRRFTVTGTTYNPRDGNVEGFPNVTDVNMQTYAKTCVLCNDAVVQCRGEGFNAIGMPTEAALLVLAEKLGFPGRMDQQIVEAAHLGQLSIDRARKSMSVIVAVEDSHDSLAPNVLLVKGAAEFVLERCTTVQLRDGSVVPLTPDFRQQILENVNRMASKSLRVLALAFKTDLGSLTNYTGVEDPAHAMLMNPENYVQIESGLAFVGLAGLQDPPRPEVKSAISDCKRAGVNVVVITGDNRNTAEAICSELGVFDGCEDLITQSFLGSEFMRLSQRERDALFFKDGSSLSRDFVFSRAEPIHKQEIGRTLRGGGEVVAMTGDGVNDAPALKLADIGVAMGITGTEVAKEASDMVLADDNFSTIVTAIREGRSIYDNMKAFIRYLISSNIGEVIAIFVTALLGFPQGLTPVQLLWVNLVTDGAPATALGFNNPDKDIMDRSPRLASDGLVSGWALFRFVVVGTYVGLATIGTLAIWYLNDASFLGIDMSKDGHSAVSLQQLMSWGQCPLWSDFQVSSFTAGSAVYTFTNPCDYFTAGNVKASSLAMSTLVLIEMFNALNALSENNSLLTVPPWSNKWLLLAIAVSMGLHIAILYTPWLADAFGVVPLSFEDWLLVLVMSLPVIPLDEALKFIGRSRNRTM